MAYENVNTNKLKSSINTIESISCNKKELKKIANSLNASNWSENSRVRIKNALEEMVDVYEDIEKYLEKCKTAADYIEQYKKLDNKNKQYQNKVNSNNRKIKNAGEDDDMSDLENKVFSYKNDIAANNTKKNNLKEKINNLIN